MENGNETTEYIIPYSLTKHQNEFQKQNIIYLSIFYHKTLSGFFILNNEPESKSVEFRRIVISNKGNGLGQSAIKEMHSYCKNSLNAESVWLDVFEHNSRGRHIYKKLGYEKFKTEPYEKSELHFYRKKL